MRSTQEAAESFSCRLAAKRICPCMTQAELCGALGKSKQTICGWGTALAPTSARTRLHRGAAKDLLGRRMIRSPRFPFGAVPATASGPPSASKAPLYPAGRLQLR